jgi:hypothetical protein
VVAHLVKAGSWNVSQPLADELCYRFEYDQLNHLIVKKTPGTPTGMSGEVWMVYDQRNRLVMQQDGNLRGNKQWLYIQYDNLNRPIAQGLITDPSDYTTLNYHVTNAAASANTPACISAWPPLSSYTTELLSQIFYDNYSSIPSTLPTGSFPVSAALTSLLGAFGGSSAVTSTLSHSALDGSAFNTSATGPTGALLSPMLNSSSSQSGPQAPYAGINYIIFDDQFRPQGTVVGFDPVSTTSDNIKNHNLPVTIPKNGYIFVYVSNQSNINVYFDNLQVVQTHGPILEETHYYPVGLAMAGISVRALYPVLSARGFQAR